MTTATRPKSKTTPLTELERLEAAWAEAAENTKALGRTHSEKQNAVRQLIDQRDRLLHRDPGQFNHDGSPLAGDNQAAEIHRAIDALGQTNYSSEIAHAERLETAAKNHAHIYIEKNHAAIFEALRPVAERVTADVHDKIAAAREATDAYLALVQRAEGLTVPVNGLSTRAVPGLDAVAELKRVLQGWELPVPLPELPR